MTAPPEQVTRYSMEGFASWEEDETGNWLQYGDHLTAIAAARAEGIREAAAVAERHSVRREYQDEILGAMSGRNFVKPETIRDAILALIPAPPADGGDNG